MTQLKMVERMMELLPNQDFVYCSELVQRMVEAGVVTPTSTQTPSVIHIKADDGRGWLLVEQEEAAPIREALAAWRKTAPRSSAEVAGQARLHELADEYLVSLGVEDTYTVEVTERP